jgi:hypothetical protein
MGPDNRLHNLFNIEDMVSGSYHLRSLMSETRNLVNAGIGSSLTNYTASDPGRY